MGGKLVKIFLFTSDQGVWDIHYVVLQAHEMQNTRAFEKRCRLNQDQSGLLWEVGDGKLTPCLSPPAILSVYSLPKPLLTSPIFVTRSVKSSWDTAKFYCLACLKSWLLSQSSLHEYLINLSLNYVCFTSRHICVPKSSSSCTELSFH